MACRLTGGQDCDDDLTMHQIGNKPATEQLKARHRCRTIPTTGVTLALALFLGLVGCSAPPAVRIGLLVPAGDPAAAQSATRGAQLALKGLNGVGTGPHFQLEVAEVGDSASIERRMSALASGGAIGVVTADQAVAEAAAASAARVRLPLIDAAPNVPSATGEKNPFLFLAGSTLDAQV